MIIIEFCLLTPLSKKMIRNNDIENIESLIQVRMNLLDTDGLEVMDVCDGDAKKMIWGSEGIDRRIIFLDWTGINISLGVNLRNIIE